MAYFLALMEVVSRIYFYFDALCSNPVKAIVAFSENCIGIKEKEAGIFILEHFRPIERNYHWKSHQTMIEPSKSLQLTQYPVYYEPNGVIN